MTQWNSILTAPKDGSEIIVFWWEETWPCVALVTWNHIEHGWFQDEFDVYPTHWMPIPPFPDGPGSIQKSKYNLNVDDIVL